jgi:tape measure domain-containing protein
MLVGEVFARMGLDSKQYEKNLGRLEGVTQKQANTLGGIFKNAFSVALGMGVFEAVKRGFRAVVGESISFNAQMEQARIGFTTMLGSAERAEVFLRDMADFAARTPFEFPELLDASKRMLAYGFAAKDVLPTMEAVGNASAAVGLGTEGINRIILALGQMRAKGKLSAEEMRQLTETGIPAWEILAEAMNKTTAEIMDMQSKGLIPADRAIKMLVEGMNKRFPNMMAQMEDTWEGVTSTIKDVWQMTIGAMTSGLFRGLTTWLQGVRDWATEFYDTLRQQGLQAALAKSFGADFAAAVSLASAVLRGFWGTLRYVVQLVREHWQVLRFAGIAMLVYTAATKGAAAATLLFKNVNLLLSGNLITNSFLLKVVGDAIVYYKVQMLGATVAGNIFTAALIRIKAALIAVHTAMGPIGWAILGVSLLIAGGMAIWNSYTASLQKASQAASQANLAKQFRELEGSTAASTQAITDQTQAMEDANKAASSNVQAFDEVHQLQEEMAQPASQTARLEPQTLGDLGAFGAPNIDDMIAGIEAGIEQAKPTLAGVWDYIKQGAANAWAGIKGAAVSAWNAIIGTIAAIWQGIVNLTRPIWEPVAAFFAGLWEGIKGVATTVWNALSAFFNTVWSGIVTVATVVWNGLAALLNTVWSGIVSIATVVWNGLAALLNTVWSGIVSIATVVWNGLAALLNTVWSGIVSAATVIWNGLAALLNTVWSGIVSAATAIWSVLGPFFSGLWEGIRSAAVTAWNTLSPFLSTVWNAIISAGRAAFNSFSAFMSSLWNSMYATATTIWNGISSALTTVWSNIRSTATTVWNAVRQAIEVPIATASSVVQMVTGGMRDALLTAWNWIMGQALAVWSLIQQYIVTPIETARANLAGIAESIRVSIANTWNAILQKISDLKASLYARIVEPWNNAKTTISKLVSDAKNWGKNLIDNIIDGIKSKYNSLKSALSNAVNTIKSYLGFSSPTEEGPGRDADKWAPNLMQMYAGGITAGIPKVRSAVNAAASELTGLTAMPAVAVGIDGTAGIAGSADAIAQAVYRAMMDAARITSASTDNQPQGTQEIVLRIDSATFARLMLPSIIKEGQRQGLNLVVQPQGV